MKLEIRKLLTVSLAAFIAGKAHTIASAQAVAATGQLPDAPSPRLLALSNVKQSDGDPSFAQQSVRSAAAAPAEDSPRLTRQEAEQMAIKNNPRISVSRLLALAQHQAVREARSGELPTSTASVTAVDAEDGSRISAGPLTASRLFEHAGAGANFSQLITDLGRTHNLISAAKLEEKAQNANAMATENDIVIATDQAFYSALEAQALDEVAKQNVNMRQTTDTQVGQLTKNKLKSTLDLSFSNVNLSQAKLMLLDAQNNLDSS